MELAIRTSGETLEVADDVFGVSFNEPLVHQVVVGYLAAGRAGTRAQKNRSDVSGGGRKPWRQKGTGRARSGTIRSPLWRGGGVTFAARPQDWSQKINRKQYRAAMRSILAELARQDRLYVVEAFDLDDTKTKAAVAKLNELGLSQALIVTPEVDERLYLSTRNLHGVEVVDAVGLDPVSLVGAEAVIMTVAAVKMIEERLK